MASPEKHVSRQHLLAYASPGFVLAIPTLPVAIYLPTLYGAEIGIAVVGLVLLLVRSLDVVTDPLIGALSDRWRFQWGRRKPWIAVGSLVGGLALIQLFQPPQNANVGHLATWSVLLYLGWTMVNVPYSAWGAEMSADYHQRTRITTAREGAMLMGILLAGAVPAVMTALGYAERDALAALSWVAVLAGAPLIFWMVLRVPDPLPKAIPRQALSWKNLSHEAGLILGNGPFRRLVVAWFVNGLANGIPATLFLLFLEHRLHLDATGRGVFILVYFLAAVLAMPVWLRLSRAFGKHRAWCWAMIATCAAFVWAPFLGPGDVFAFVLICAVTGFGLGADLALPPALQADVIDLDTARSGRERAGLFFSFWGMAAKLALAAAVGIAFPLLAFFGFDARGDNAPPALFALGVIYAAVSVVLKGIVIVMIWNFPVSADVQRALRADIARFERQARP